jgi:threonine aldolase
VLAAAGLVALDRIDRLAEDHARAASVAAGLRERGWRVQEPETNIVLVAVADLSGTLARFAESGVRASAMAGKVRLMTHADLTDADVGAALDRIGPLERAARQPAASARRAAR